MEHWLQNYDPLQNAFLSTIVAALPVVVLLTAIAFFHLRIHLSALLGLAVALAVARFAYRMPLQAAATNLDVVRLGTGEILECGSERLLGHDS